jgi:hypothetical protein
MFPDSSSIGGFFSFCIPDIFFSLTAFYCIELFQPGAKLEQHQAKLSDQMPAYASALPGQLCQQPSLFCFTQKIWIMSLQYLFIEV